MKVLKYLFAIVLFSTISMLSSCANAEKAKPVAEEFYSKMQQQDYKSIEALLSKEMVEQSSVSEIMSFIIQKEDLGELKSFERDGEGKVMEIDNKQVVRFLYITKYTNKDLYEYLRLVLVGEDYLVDSYGYFETKEKREEYIQHAE